MEKECSGSLGKILEMTCQGVYFSKVAGYKPAALQKISSITFVFEESVLKFPEQVFHRIHLSGCFLILYS